MNPWSRPGDCERRTPEGLKAVLAYLGVVPTRFLASAGLYGGRFWLEPPRGPRELSGSRTPGPVYTQPTAGGGGASPPARRGIIQPRTVEAMRAAGLKTGDTSMSSYDVLKKKWRDLSDSGKATTCFNDETLDPGKFCVHIHDEGHSGPCGSCIETTGFFEDAKDALAYYRFAEIPRLLQWLSGADTAEPPQEAEAYLRDFEDENRVPVEELLGLIDRALKVDVPAPELLSRIRDQHNELFKDTNPMNQILAWGTVAETLRSPFFAEALEEAAEEPNEAAGQLKGFLGGGDFDANTPAHLSLAAAFLERCASF